MTTDKWQELREEKIGTLHELLGAMKSQLRMIDNDAHVDWSYVKEIVERADKLNLAMKAESKKDVNR